MATGWQWLTGVASTGGDGGDLQGKAVSPEEASNRITGWEVGGGWSRPVDGRYQSMAFGYVLNKTFIQLQLTVCSYCFSG